AVRVTTTARHTRSVLAGVRDRAGVAAVAGGVVRHRRCHAGPRRLAAGPDVALVGQAVAVGRSARLARAVRDVAALDTVAGEAVVAVGVLGAGDTRGRRREERRKVDVAGRGVASAG